MKANQVDLAGFINLTVKFCLEGMVDLDFESQPKMRAVLLAKLRQEA
jgi:hypothetical protein